MAEISRTEIELVKRELDMIRCELAAMKHEYTPKRKRKKTERMIEWEENNAEVIKFIQTHRRLPLMTMGEDTEEHALAKWLQIAIDHDARNSLSLEQQQVFLYTKGLVDGISLSSVPYLEDELEGLLRSLEQPIVCPDPIFAVCPDQGNGVLMSDNHVATSSCSTDIG